MRHLLGTALACSFLALTAGCGDEPRDAAPQPDGSPTSTSRTPEPTASPTKPPSEGLEKLRVVGLVVEVGDCVVVRDDNGTTWTMTGDRAGDLTLDERVQVTGTPQLAATGCGGPPVEVSRFTYLPLPE
ncbi:hypothetical protein KDN32_21290 [Nocardioides sp. J2M5]|uniref:DUF5818 domain-containing protein n=1 Tax=Nocardioides palaemonis TaxID=2829810 RepID=UPI001BA45EF5|nr:DUF5818 domain-containing protein [Nocardioides palaemonis]MBS2940278.1 hypothetical protein [Nocardioides palaemonis]